MRRGSKGGDRSPEGGPVEAVWRKGPLEDPWDRSSHLALTKMMIMMAQEGPASRRGAQSRNPDTHKFSSEARALGEGQAPSEGALGTHLTGGRKDTLGEQVDQSG